MESSAEVTSSSRSIRGPCSKDNNRGPAKCYNSLMVVVFFVLFLDSVISLGSFGVLQYRVSNFWDVPGVKRNTCILFGGYNRTKDGVVIINLSHIGSCAFVLWGLMSVMIVGFVWMIFSFVQIFISSKVCSFVRILDFVVLFLTCLLSFSLSIAISAGIRSTCSANPNGYSCSQQYLVKSLEDKDTKLYYYQSVHSSETSSWVASVMLAGLTIWNIITIIVFVKRKKRRGEVAMTRFHDEDDRSSSEEELEDVADSKESQKKPNSFTNT